MMNKTLPTIIGLLTLLLLLTGCAKDDALKEPSKVGVRFALNSTGVGGSDRLELSAGYVTLGAIEIEGERTEGDAFIFKRTFPSGLRIDFNATSSVEDLLFDLPQGEYENLKVRFTTLEQSNTPCLMVLGKYGYRQPANGSTWVDIAWRTGKTFERVVTTVQGAPTFTLEEASKTITFSIQPKLWFQGISEVKLEQALCTSSTRGQVMLIDPITNDNMFQVIDLELGTTLKATL
ncbi:MAG: hypothetical protein ACRBFS_05365 [Aureispira sp.]